MLAMELSTSMLWARAILGSRSRERALILRRFQASDTTHLTRLQAVSDQDGALRNAVHLLRRRRWTLSTTSPSESVDSGRASTFAPAPRYSASGKPEATPPGLDQHLDPGAHHLLHRRRNGGNPLLAFHAFFQDGHSHRARRGASGRKM